MFRILAFGLCAVVIFGQAPPAPTEDRVGFPANYKTAFTKLTTVERADNGQIRVIYGNAIAANTPWWEQYPYGSVLLFESWTSKRDTQNGILTDENGRFIPDVLGTLFVQRKERGFGEAYGPNRNGEWEYVAYRPDGTVSTLPQNTGACAVCHLLAGPQNDYIFRRSHFSNPFNPGGTPGAAPTATMSHYRFIPGNITVKQGTTVTWYNDDEVEHHIFSPNGGFNSAPMFWGSSYSYKFEAVGEFDIRCTLHSGMSAKVKVE